MDQLNLFAIKFCFAVSGIAAGIACTSSDPYVVGINVGGAVFIFGLGIVNCFNVFLRKKN